VTSRWETLRTYRSYAIGTARSLAERVPPVVLREGPSVLPFSRFSPNPFSA
jgi:hypothetical protein